MHTVNGIGTTIYGRAKRQELAGAGRLAAEQAGYLPSSHQVVKWFVFIFLPIILLGTYRVMKAHQKFWTLDFPRYSIPRVDWDWKQIAVHYSVAYGWILLLVALAFLA